MDLKKLFTISTWWGKLIGAFFGYLTGGPVGAFFGILIGNVFDQGLSSHYLRGSDAFREETRHAVQEAFFETTFSVMGFIAKADGRVTEKEIHLAKSVMNEMALTSAQMDKAKEQFQRGKSKDFNIDSALLTLDSLCRHNQALLNLFLDIQYRAATVDGLTAGKQAAFDRVLMTLGLAPLRSQYRYYHDSSFKGQRQQHQQQSSSHKHYQSPKNPSEQAYALLEVKPDATEQEVKKSYRRLLSKNHPDKLIAQGLPDEMIKVANIKTQKIREAYEHICELKGWHY